MLPTYNGSEYEKWEKMEHSEILAQSNTKTQLGKLQIL